MTQKQTLAAIRALGLVARFDPETREYRVAHPLSVWANQGFPAWEQRTRQEAESYYTNDADDALATARRMAA